MTIIAFFNASCGVGQTSFVYHLAWMYESLQVPVLVADLDPQANLTSRFLDTVQLDALWGEVGDSRKSICDTLAGLADRVKPESNEPPLPRWEEVSPGVTVIAGDPKLARVETKLSELWNERSTWNDLVLHFLLDFRSVLHRTARENGAELVLLDVGPHLTALNRFALAISDATVIPLGTDLRSLYGLRAFGPTLWQWRRECTEFLKCRSDWQIDYPRIPRKQLSIAGFIMQEGAYYCDRPADVPERWRDRVRREYERSIIHEPGVQYQGGSESARPLATIRDQIVLSELAEDARKPMFRLTPADGVYDGQTREVTASYHDYENVARSVAESCGIQIPCIDSRS